MMNLPDPHTDCHCHILPALDDGSPSLEESVGLARRQVGWGFRKAVCTSHRTRLYPNEPQAVIEACQLLQEELRCQGVPLELVPSMEYRLIPETWPETLEKGWLLPWEGRHILIELPISNPAKIGNIVPEEEIRRLLDAGYQPVLAHPERYLYLTEERYRSLKDAGVLFQRNIGSREGLYGPAVSERARRLMADGLYDIAGTDLHNQRYAQFFDSFGFHAGEREKPLKTIEVVAAIIRKGDKVFATQRGYGEWKDWWEWPGGKVEEGESPEEALAREIREELDTEIRVDKFLTTVEWDYPQFHLTLHCYMCSLQAGALHLKEHEAARWLSAETLPSVRWLPADEGILPLIQEELRF